MASNGINSTPCTPLNAPEHQGSCGPSLACMKARLFCSSAAPPAPVARAVRKNAQLSRVATNDCGSLGLPSNGRAGRHQPMGIVALCLLEVARAQAGPPAPLAGAAACSPSGSSIASALGGARRARGEGASRGRAAKEPEGPRKVRAEPGRLCGAWAAPTARPAAAVDSCLPCGVLPDFALPGVHSPLWTQVFFPLSR